MNQRAGEEVVAAVDDLLLGGEPCYDSIEVAARAGVDPVLAARLWRAVGFPDVEPGRAWFTDADVEALSLVARLARTGVGDIELTVHLARVVGSSMARVAEAQIDALESLVEGPLREAGMSGEEVAVAMLTFMANLLPEWSRMLDYVHHRHLEAAVKRTALWRDETRSSDRSLVVGFVDLVGFTALSQQLAERELYEVVDRFESSAYDTVAGHGGRVVKMIGDEVMFVNDDTPSAAFTALELAEAYADENSVTNVRAGLASGPVLAREADYFGPVVNLASRMVNIALPGTAVVADAVHTALEDHPAFRFKAMRPRRLKGIGSTPLWVLRRNRAEARV